MNDIPPNLTTAARRIILSGQVQGVGFRPFIYRLAQTHRLCGWVRNCLGIVEIHVQGQAKNLDGFVDDIFNKKPALARPVLESEKSVDIAAFKSFEILQSQQQGESQISLPLDLFLCDDCLSELNDPCDRRYQYPFINCTQCGPRYTLIRCLPYDRANTSMAAFALCPLCRAEYEDPENRRFHAEPVACPVCGPSLSFRSADTVVEGNEQSIASAVAALRSGDVIAVKGIGGYHLMCDAENTAAVSRLRENKRRPDKPLAVMFPAPPDSPFRYADASVNLTDNDKAFLLQAARPILLLTKKHDMPISAQIAPGLNEVGVMLPYSPLHHLLLNQFGGPLLATSANISGEPVLTHNPAVEKRLAHVAAAYLHHNRPIERPADDPVYRSIAGKPRPIRLGRGTAPTEIKLPFTLEQAVLGVGAHMKNTVTLAWSNRAVISPHMGEMNSSRSLEVFQHTVDDLQKLYDVKAAAIICDAHPGYTTTRWAHKQNKSVRSVFHHHAHASAAYYECQRRRGDNDAVLIFSWDGTGYGEDGALWGGETFLGRPGAWQRVASMRPFYLPGGDKAGRAPWRSAAALCWETGIEYEGIPEKDRLLKQAWQRKMNAPQTTAVGRLFDAAAALTGVCQQASFEGQGPMLLESLSEKTDNYIELDLESNGNLLICNWAALLPLMLETTLSVAERASLFHASMAQVILQQALALREKSAVNVISFSGGVFQNRVLTEQAIALLSTNGFDVYFPELLPVNDAGISFGQVMEYGYENR